MTVLGPLIIIQMSSRTPIIQIRRKYSYYHPSWQNYVFYVFWHSHIHPKTVFTLTEGLISYNQSIGLFAVLLNSCPYGYCPLTGGLTLTGFLHYRPY